ncbi:hypothetical protein M0802_003859 [Mischocyttarus mexicanus]|nr:hypothetical protein M0802_003859 [Mischocyttarus mexicanus]
MENNFLKYISQVTLSPLTNLSIAKFSNNQLVFGKESKVWSPFYHNHYLKELHLSYNSIEDFFNDWSMSYTLILLNLTHNNIDTISAGNFHFQSKKILVDLSYNKIKNIFMDDIKATAIDQTEKRDVVVLLDYNPILCDCYLYDLIRYFHNEMPTFVYNYIEIVGENLSCIYTDGTMGPKMKELNSTIYFCPENKYFNIDTNCPFNCTCSVRLKDKTRILDCSNKNIFNFVIDEKSVYFVNNFPVILNLTGNALTKLPSIKPLKPIKITTLLLSNNRISEITIDELPKDLEVLELHNNYISSIDSNVMKRLLPGFLYSLTLSGNPIVCDCGAVDLLQYVVVYRSFYEDLNKLKCEHMDFPMYFMSSESFCPPVSGLEEKIRIAGRLRTNNKYYQRTRRVVCLRFLPRYFGLDMYKQSPERSVILRVYSEVTTRSHHQKMIAIILVILFGTFITINTESPPCRNNTNCQCSLTSLDDIEMDFVGNRGIEIIVHVLSWNRLEVNCKGIKKLEDFYYSSKPPGKTINSLSIRSCVLSNITSLENFVKKLGIVESKIFSFQSFKTKNTLLTRQHLKGISNVKELVLSYNNLSNISIDFFVDFPKLEKLDLSHNNLTQLNDIFNATPHLKYLDLNKNNIYSHSSTLFYKLENLEHLDLGYNRLEKIQESTFDKQVSLKSLNIKANKMNFLPVKFFRKLKKLETIDISLNSFAGIPRQLFIENKNLRRVLYHNNTINLVTLPENLFSNFKKLEEIDLKKIGLLSLPKNLFYYSPSLKYIYLDHNILANLPQTAFQGLKNLEVLTINDNLIQDIPKGIFSDLEKLKVLDLDAFEGLTSLTELNMENNRLKYIDPETLIPLSKLNIAKFSNNQLVFSKETNLWSPFQHNHYLTELHLSNNSIRSIFSDWLIGYNLTFLNLSHNNISTVLGNSFYFPSNKILVDLSYNKISNILFHGIEASAIYQTEKRDVIVFIDHNPILCDCNLYDLIRFFHNEMPISVHNYIEIIAENLTCVHTNGTIGPIIQELNSTTYICPEDVYFKVETNCPNNCTCSLRPKDKIRIFDCSNRNMSDFVSDENRVYFMNSFPVILNLTGNALTRIPLIDHLKPIILTGLLLSNNRISEIAFDRLPLSLKELELHNNNISRIDSNVIKHLISSLLTELTLSGNPIICDCDVEDLFYFIQLNQFTFEDLNKLKCKDMDVPMHNMSFEGICPPVYLDVRKKRN